MTSEGGLNLAWSALKEKRYENAIVAARKVSREHSYTENVTTGKKTHCDRGRFNSSLDGYRNDRAAGSCHCCNTSRLERPCN
jgi:hypothetical protein